uniref:rRNA biogenesis protein RRP36 n=1 Tax=Gasterosteus aculeatus aculeatus TaxID=481459 RepID=A0AAQ4S866_GASAC|nr:ribosomal RNA processing protein 36 homolog [Gasterosteus aculeatus aculeatus]
MKGKEKQLREMTVSKKKNMAASSSSDDEEDSDAERNYALLTGKGAKWAEPGVSDEDEGASDGGAEEEGGEEGSDDGEEPSNRDEEEEEDDDDSNASEDDVDGDPEDAGGSGEIQTEHDIKKELSNMSFEDIMKLQSQVGTKAYNKLAYGGGKSGGKSRGATKKKRLNKNRPMEISSKRRAPFLRQVVSVKKPMQRDPRFDDLSGEYKPEIFEKTFKFINDIKLKEREIIEKKLRKSKNSENKDKLEFLLKRMDNQERARQRQEQQRERELQFKREQRERANQGERPYFLKNSDKKKLQLAEKFQELKKSGKLENFLSKKRKRNAGKDRRKLPRQLLNSSGQGSWME